jgi:hypothetical protein
MFIPGKHLQPSPTFEVQLGIERVTHFENQVQEDESKKLSSVATPNSASGVRLGCKCLLAINALAYCAKEFRKVITVIF